MEKLEQFMEEKARFHEGSLFITYEDMPKFLEVIGWNNNGRIVGYGDVVNYSGNAILSGFGFNLDVMFYKDSIAFEVETLQYEIEDEVFAIIEDFCYWR